MSRTYCGTAVRGTAPDASTASGSNCVAASSVTMSPELIVSTGLFAASKFPIFTVRGEGISVYSAAIAIRGMEPISMPIIPIAIVRINPSINLSIEKAPFVDSRW
jgi:hypothetical protein